MRGVLALVAVVVLLLIVGVATGFINLGQTQEAKLPEVEGGQLPKFDADVGDVDVGTKTETIEVPTIDVDTAKTDASEDKDK
jgi:beta-lactam-binding protein with PASTA domain